MPKDHPQQRNHKDGNGPQLRLRAQAVAVATLKAGAALYDRQRDLPRLIRIDPGAGAECETKLAAIVQRLARALRAERNRARSGHWTYDLNRHIALRQAYLAESDRLAALKRTRR